MAGDDLLQGTIDRFWDTIPPVWGRVRGNARENAIQDYGLTLVQFHVLRHIRRGARTVSELAERQQISRPAISQAVELLVEKGLVTRQQDASDRRFVQLDLTESGGSLLNAVFDKNRRWMAEKMAALRPEELETLSCAMTILKTTFEPTEEYPTAVK
jgi:DNA-binding MarR family transcriptional regulator